MPVMFPSRTARRRPANTAKRYYSPQVSWATSEERTGLSSFWTEQVYGTGNRPAHVHPSFFEVEYFAEDERPVKLVAFIEADEDDW